MRKLPVYILIDTSGSMKGEPIESVNVGLASMLTYLRQNPYALENTALSIITYDSEVKCLVPLTMVDDLNGIPTITTPSSGGTNTGAALKKVCELADREVMRTTPDRKGDWAPLLFVLTDGRPSDLQLYREMTAEVKKRRWGNIIGCAAGMKADVQSLKMLTENVVALDTMDSTAFGSLFKFITQVSSQGAESVGKSIDSHQLPPPPEEINIVV